MSTSTDLVVAITDALIGAKDELSALDAVAGDGDMGVTFANGCAAILELLPTLEDSAPSAVMRGIGIEISKKAPSTAGTLVAFGLLAAAKDAGANGEPAADAASYARVLGVIADTISTRGKAVVGDQTIMDSLTPAAAAAAEVATAGGTTADAAVAAAKEVRLGAASTTGMTPKFGRASWLVDRAAGSPDAGASAAALVLEAVAQHLAP